MGEPLTREMLEETFKKIESEGMQPSFFVTAPIEIPEGAELVDVEIDWWGIKEVWKVKK